MNAPSPNDLAPREILDGHVHFENLSLIQSTKDYLQTLGISKLALVSYGRLQRVNANPHALCFKAAYPSETYILGGPDYSDIQGKTTADLAKSFLDQAIRLEAIGFDGIKLLETKPTVAKAMPFPISDPAYEGFFGYLEEKGTPIIWHVADPEEMWTEEGLCPVAKEKGWHYGDGSYPSKETLYGQVNSVLGRFPNLKIIFAHFYFLSADLPRASAFLDRHANVNLDITPGTEMYLNFSHSPDETRDFFVKYQDRIVFGDDTAIRAPELDRKAVSEKVAFMRTFLETDGEFIMPEGDDCFLHREGTVHGIQLPESVLAKIYSANFLSIVGARPRPIDIQAAGQECERIGSILRDKYEISDNDNFGFQAANRLRKERAK